LKEGMEVCQEMLKRTYRPALEAKRDMRRCWERERENERERSSRHHTEVQWKRQEVPDRKVGELHWISLFTSMAPTKALRIHEHQHTPDTACLLWVVCRLVRCALPYRSHSAHSVSKEISDLRGTGIQCNMFCVW
jgi:hypothetical protein